MCYAGEDMDEKLVSSINRRNIKKNKISKKNLEQKMA